MNDTYYMNKALQEAKKAFENGEVPVGAIIVKNGKIIAKAHNLKESKKNPVCHAEILAIRKACKKINNWRLNDCIMYVSMFPCPMCAGAINQARISKVVCGNVPKYVDKTVIYSILSDKNYGLPVEIVENVLENDSLLLLKQFFEKKR